MIFDTTFGANNYIERVLQKHGKLYACEVLFDDWCNIDKLFEDKDVQILYCNITYKNGIRDRKLVHKILPAQDDTSYHFPVFRIKFVTSSLVLYKNIEKTITISYKGGEYPLFFNYNLILSAKEKDISRTRFLSILHYQIIVRFKNSEFRYKLLSDNDWWEFMYNELKEKDIEDKQF